ncbi:MAG TPA: hypothetical protein VFT98_21245 [Myxococcota bacterium]|nr:hypothetical protein [Myxococcota bacterium]
MRLISALVLGLGILAGSSSVAADPLFTSRLFGNIADQSIAGFAASSATWTLERGRVSLLPQGGGRALLVVKTRGLIIPAIGINPSPDLLARIVCHDEAGTPFEAARTRAVPFPESGDATLREAVLLPDACFAPIVLLTGSRDPAGNSPGNWFAVSSL